MKSAKFSTPMPAGPVRDEFRAEALAAASLLARESASSVRLARRHVLQARSAAKAGTARDRAFAAVLHDWWRGRRGAALAGFVQLVASDPTDADVAAWASHLAYTEGDERALLFVSGALADVRPTLPLVHGLRAIALAQAGHDGEAVICARHALSMDPDQPHAQAVIADDHARRGDVAGALDMLDMELLPAAQTDALALQRAISLLWRMEMQGWDVGSRWREVGDMVQARDRKSTRLNSSHWTLSRMPSSA